MITLRQILEEIAVSLGVSPHPIRLTAIPNEHIAWDSEGMTVYFESWAIAEPPTEAQRDAAVARLTEIPPPTDAEVGEVPVLGEFPDAPAPYARVIVPRLGLDPWTWHPGAGASGEWWGNEWTVRFGHAAVARSNQYLRMFGYIPNAYNGMILTDSYRILRISGQWWAECEGLFQARVNGISAGREFEFSGKRLDYAPGVRAPQWVIGKPNQTDRALGCVWVGKGRMSGYNFRIEGRRVWTT